MENNDWLIINHKIQLQKEKKKSYERGVIFGIYFTVIVIKLIEWIF
jgi:hypothetical protein